MKLTIRKNGKYYQLGYYDNSKWINVHQLGTPEKINKMVCRLRELENTLSQLSEHTN
jgi:hypothetical protein